MQKCVIIGGADILNYDFIVNKLSKDYYFIYCDSGLKHRKALGFEPNLIIGDFDSFQNPNENIETIVLPTVKDDTDTVFAMKEALKRGFEDFIIIGVIGGRLDHTLGNVSMLLYLHSLNKTAVIIDDYSEMQIVDSTPTFIDDSYSFFSLLCLTGKACGVTIKNAKYELSNAEITTEYQYGVSNEPLKNKTTEITVKEGCLLLIKDR